MMMTTSFKALGIALVKPEAHDRRQCKKINSDIIASYGRRSCLTLLGSRQPQMRCWSIIHCQLNKLIPRISYQTVARPTLYPPTTIAYRLWHLLILHFLHLIMREDDVISTMCDFINTALTFLVKLISISCGVLVWSRIPCGNKVGSMDWLCHRGPLSFFVLTETGSTTKNACVIRQRFSLQHAFCDMPILRQEGAFAVYVAVSAFLLAWVVSEMVFIGGRVVDWRLSLRHIIRRLKRKQQEDLKR